LFVTQDVALLGANQGAAHTEPIQREGGGGWPMSPKLALEVPDAVCPGVSSPCCLRFSIQTYTLRCDMKRSLLAKDLTKTCEFIVHSAPQKGKLTPSPVDFTITPDTLQNVKERALLPKFLIRGHLNSTNCVITQPLTGELVVESSEAAIKSIELQLVRVETCGCAEGYARDATEIQNIQIADGDVCRSLSVPIYMVFPRLFTCPTLETTNFKVEFEVNVVVLLHPDHLITENFPLKLCRM
uniref:VPS26 endosomal protein sorting factor C n=1 Tax=Sus scrofa TaxID=9823 RepID=A0A8D1HPT5_PIG